MSGQDSNEKSRESRKIPGIGNLPPAYDLALRWGLTLAIAVLAGLFLGRWLDNKLGSTPLFLLIGVFWGLTGSFYSLYLQVKRLQQEENHQKNNPPEAKSPRENSN